MSRGGSHELVYVLKGFPKRTKTFWLGTIIRKELLFTRMEEGLKNDLEGKSRVQL